MPTDEGLEAARALRRAMLGDAYVDAQTAESNSTLQEFQDYIAAQAWESGRAAARSPHAIAASSYWR